MKLTISSPCIADCCKCDTLVFQYHNISFLSPVPVCLCGRHCDQHLQHHSPHTAAHAHSCQPHTHRYDVFTDAFLLTACFFSFLPALSCSCLPCLVPACLVLFLPALSCSCLACLVLFLPVFSYSCLSYFIHACLLLFMPPVFLCLHSLWILCL